MSKKYNPLTGMFEDDPNFLKDYPKDPQSISYLPVGTRLNPWEINSTLSGIRANIPKNDCTFDTIGLELTSPNHCVRNNAVNAVNDKISRMRDSQDLITQTRIAIETREAEFKMSLDKQTDDYRREKSGDEFYQKLTHKQTFNFGNYLGNGNTSSRGHTYDPLCNCKKCKP